MFVIFFKKSENFFYCLLCGCFLFFFVILKFFINFDTNVFFQNNVVLEEAAQYFFIQTRNDLYINKCDLKRDDDKKVKVKSNLFLIELDLDGGDIGSLLLLQHKGDSSGGCFMMFNKDSDRYYFPQSGILRPTDSVSHKFLFTSKQKFYETSDNDSVITVDLVYTFPNSVELIKRYIFEKNSYVIKVCFIVVNKTSVPFFGKIFYRLIRKNKEQSNFFNGVVGSFVGAAVNTKTNLYKKITFNELEKNIFQQILLHGWLAMVERYFISAWLPTTNLENYYVAESLGDHVYSVSCFSKELFLVESGKTITFSADLYTGPTVVKLLKETNTRLDLAVDYGIFWPIAKIIFILLCFVYKFVNNWGFSIILVTIFIKLFFYPLSAISYRSMKKMKFLQPKILVLKNIYLNDKQKLNLELINLYKKENINPFSGCLPMLIQIPVFISLYYVILEAVEFRKSRFIFWIDDLSSFDPFFILPILMGVSMYFQQILTPIPSDEIQVKIMKFLPIIFTFLFLKFPSGLVLYWFVNNTVSIVQQWFVMKYN